MIESPMMTEWRTELEARRARVRRLLEEAGCDVGLVFGCDGHAEHFRYLTNFAPVLGDSWLIMDAGERCVLTFQWQIVEARGHSGIEQWEAAFDSVSLVREILQAAEPRRLGIAGLERMPAPSYAALREAFPEMEIANLGPRVAELRRRKSELEVKLMREAARITDLMLDAARQGVQVGMSE
ncbi:MAG TPA: aminopeptidase P family N-terminal domain-containing protein, partial [Chloroflexota bacterium]